MCGHRRGRDAFLAINTPCQSAGATSICQKLKYPRRISDTCSQSSKPKCKLFIKTSKKNTSVLFSNSTRVNYRYNMLYTILIKNHIYHEKCF